MPVPAAGGWRVPGLRHIIGAPKVPGMAIPVIRLTPPTPAFSHQALSGGCRFLVPGKRNPKQPLIFGFGHPIKTASVYPQSVVVPNGH